MAIVKVIKYLSHVHHNQAMQVYLTSLSARNGQDYTVSLLLCLPAAVKRHNGVSACSANSTGMGQMARRQAAIPLFTIILVMDDSRIRNRKSSFFWKSKKTKSRFFSDICCRFCPMLDLGLHARDFAIIHQKRS